MPCWSIVLIKSSNLALASFLSSIARSFSYLMAAISADAVPGLESAFDPFRDSSSLNSYSCLFFASPRSYSRDPVIPRGPLLTLSVGLIS